FFSSRRRHTRWPRDWSSDVCSSDWCDDGKPVRDPYHLACADIGRLAGQRRTIGSRRGTASKRNAERFGGVGGILPQSLSAHTPRGIVVNRITCAHHRLTAAKHFPGQ